MSNPLHAPPENPYLLLTPGPLSTSKSVKAEMLRDWCTWDKDYNTIVQKMRRDLVSLATANRERYTAVLMQGSGTFSVESVIGSAIPMNGKLLVLTNGAYGDRIVKIARVLAIPCIQVDSGEVAPIDLSRLEQTLQGDTSITQVAVVHCETTTGMCNNIEAVCRIAKLYGKTTIVDAMSSFGGIPMDVSDLQIDFLISSANKCIQGVPGFGFVIARRDVLSTCKGQARSLSLDLFDQWDIMERECGKWRFTSPTHVVRAFCQALAELFAEGGVAARHARYTQCQKLLADGMQSMGFSPLLNNELQSPIITSFLYPDASFSFQAFYAFLKERGFVIYPGKISQAATFRIGNIGEVTAEDLKMLLEAVRMYVMAEVLA